MTTYTTQGSVRGSCGHSHRTVSSALRCLQRDQHACVLVGGYSDRAVISSDGSLERETALIDDDDEYAEAQMAMLGL
jgi:hypothetical protein